SDGGIVFNADAVYGTASGAGSVANAVFHGVTADNSSGNGFNFNVDNGATLLADIRSGGAFGISSASGNAFDGVRFNAAGPGVTMGFLLMSGGNQFNNNGTGGVDFDAVGVNMAVAQVSGSVNDNGGDGINIQMTNVTSGAISLNGGGTGT